MWVVSHAIRVIECPIFRFAPAFQPGRPLDENRLLIHGMVKTAHRIIEFTPIARFTAHGIAKIPPTK
jgi:hypothetical protein